jgi:hypothetical protein
MILLLVCRHCQKSGICHIFDMADEEGHIEVNDAVWNHIVNHYKENHKWWHLRRVKVINA